MELYELNFIIILVIKNPKKIVSMYFKKTKKFNVMHI